MFRGKVEGKSAFTRGVFISLSGITGEARDAITRGKQPNFFVVDGHDVTVVLSGAVDLQQFLRQRQRLLAEEGLVVVPFSELRSLVRTWADEMLSKSPTALKVLKHSFNADSESIAGIGCMAFDSLELFLDTEEAREGVKAFSEKRAPDFSRAR